eukprot:5755652-Pleurochrysis_carterae.AAC.2
MDDLLAHESPSVSWDASRASAERTPACDGVEDSMQAGERAYGRLRRTCYTHTQAASLFKCSWHGGDGSEGFHQEMRADQCALAARHAAAHLVEKACWVGASRWRPSPAASAPPVRSNTHARAHDSRIRQPSEEDTSKRARA